MGISIWQLLIVLAIVLLLFGTKKLRNLGSDLGGAVKGFKSAVKEGGQAVADEGAEKLEHENRAEDGTSVAGEPAPKESERA